MQLLPQGVAATIQFGPYVDKADGVTLKTDATTITDIDHATTGIFLSKNGGTGAIRHQNVTASVADSYGMMKVVLDTTDTDTLGTLDVLFAKAATYLPVHRSFMVVPVQVYNSIVAGSDLLDVSQAQVAGTTITAQMLAAWVKFFDKASPTGTVNSLPDAVPGAVSGLVIQDAATAYTPKAIYDAMSKPATAQTITAPTDLAVNVTKWNGVAVTTPAVAGSPVVTLGATQAAYAPAKAGDVMGKSPATLAAADVSGNIPVDVKSITAGVDFSDTQKTSITTAATAATPTVTAGTVTDKSGYSGTATNMVAAPDNINIGVAAAAATAAAASAGAVQTILTGITSLGNWLRGMYRKDAMNATAKSEINSTGGTYSELTDSNEAIRDNMSASSAPSVDDINTKLVTEHGDGVWGSSAVFANTITIITELADHTRIPIVSVTCKNTTGTGLQSVVTDINGSVVTTLPNGAVTVLAWLSGYTFAASTVTVAGSQTITLTGTPLAVTQPAAGCQTVYFIPDDPTLTIDTTTKLTAQMIQQNTFVGNAIITGKPISATNMGAYFEWQLAKGGVFKILGVSNNKEFLEMTITVTTDSMRSLADYK